MEDLLQEINQELVHGTCNTNSFIFYSTEIYCHTIVCFQAARNVGDFQKLSGQSGLQKL